MLEAEQHILLMSVYVPQYFQRKEQKSVFEFDLKQLSGVSQLCGKEGVACT